MSAKKAVIIIGGLAAVGAALYFIFKPDVKRFTSKVLGGETDDSDSGSKVSSGIQTVVKPVVNTTPPPSTGCSVYRAESFPLAKCMKGAKVKELQTMLNKLYSDKLDMSIKADSYFGPATETFVYKVLGTRQVKQGDYDFIVKSYKAVTNIDI